MEKIKVILAITKGNWGGAQKYVFDLATQLPQSQYEVVVICGLGKLLPEKLSQQGIRVIQLSGLDRDVGWASDLKTFFSLVKLFNREQPQLVHLNSSKIGGLGAVAGHLVGIPKIIYTAHGWAFNEDRPWLSKLIIKLASWLTVILSQQTITVSEFDRQKLCSWPGMNKKLITIHNGIGTIDFWPREQAREKLGLNQDELVIGTIAELHKNKGLDYLPTGTVVIGGGEERSKLEKKLKLLGHIPDAAKLLKAFDVFVLPSIKEGLPYVLLEAGLAGLPTIATRVGGIPEIIDDGVNGLLVEPKDIVALNQAIKQLLANPDLAKRFGQELQQKVIEKFSTAEMVKQTVAVYNQWIINIHHL